MAPQSTSYAGPSLPRSFLDQIGASSTKTTRGGHGHVASRKAFRKQARVEKRTSRTQKPQRQYPASHAREDDDDSEEDSERSPPKKLPAPKAATGKGSMPLQSILKKPLKPASADVGKLSMGADQTESKHIPRRVKERLAQDDADIAALEKKLGIRGKKSRKGEDGLDDLLDGIDDGDVGVGKRKRREDNEWLERKRRKADEIESGSDDEDELLPGIDGSVQDADGNGLDGMSDDDNEESDIVDEEVASSSGDAVEDGFDDASFGSLEEDIEGDGSADTDADHAAEQVPKKTARENPYFAPGAGNEQSVAKYIPPSLRAASSGDAELTVRLRRQTQGLLNKLAEANLISILAEVETLYQNYPRQYVTATLIDLLLGLISDNATLMDTFLILHAGFIAAIYKVIGPDFGAQIVERVVAKLDECHKHALDTETSGKEALNLMSLLAQFYNLQVIGSELVFDYIRSFLESLSEVHTELLLRVVRSSGHQLRQDDPSSLKDIVMLLHRTVAEHGEQTLSVRTKFMIETINDLKNNKLKSGAATSAMNSEHLSRMRKILGTMSARTVRASEPMRISLGDIRNTEKRGKWWLVGASWRGKEDVGQQSEPQDIEQDDARDGSMYEDDNADQDTSTNLLTLAKSARMNTDIRRGIFITIMSASDYQDAHFRLLKLSLTRSQELDIPRVLLHCAGAEQTYNPYYTVIARKLCGEHRLRMAFQFALWDLFKKMGEKSGDDDDAAMDEEDEAMLTTSTFVNHAKLYGNVIATGGLGLNVFKNLDLVYLQPKTKAFLEILFITILLQCSKKTPKVQKRTSATSSVTLSAVFTSALAVPSLPAGLRYFLRKVVAKTDLTKGQKEKAAVKDGCKEAARLLTLDAASLMRDD